MKRLVKTDPRADSKLLISFLIFQISIFRSELESSISDADTGLKNKTRVSKNSQNKEPEAGNEFRCRQYFPPGLWFD